jgi:hypothetical protein
MLKESSVTNIITRNNHIDNGGIISLPNQVSLDFHEQSEKTCLVYFHLVFAHTLFSRRISAGIVKAEI